MWDLLALALPHQRGSLEGEGLQGLSWPMGTLDCCEDTGPVSFPPRCPSLHYCDNRHPKTPGQPRRVPAQELVRPAHGKRL